MFVAIACDMGGEDSRAALYNLLPQYGFERVQRGTFESTTIGEKELAALKRDIDRLTDDYDSLRLYQFPVEGTLAVSVLKNKKWRRVVVRDPSRTRE